MREEGGFSAGSMFFSFILGGVAGAAVALLLAPESGRETRTRIRDLAGDVREKATDYVEGVKDKMTSTVEKGRGYIEEKKSVLAKAVEAGKEAYEKEKDKLSSE